MCPNNTVSEFYNKYKIYIIHITNKCKIFDYLSRCFIIFILKKLLYPKI